MTAEITTAREIIHLLEALSQERLRKIYETMLRKALDHRESCNVAAGSELEGALEEWEDEDDIPISDYEVAENIVSEQRVVYERPKLVTIKMEGDPSSIVSIGALNMDEVLSERSISVTLCVAQALKNNGLPVVNISVVIYGPIAEDNKKRHTKKRLSLVIEQDGTLFDDFHRVYSRDFTDSQMVYLTPDSVTQSDQTTVIDLKAINDLVDQCLSMVEDVLK